MAQKKTVHKGKISQSGYWNYKDVYKMLFNWLKDHGYSVSENSYKEKLSGEGKDISVSWEASKSVTDYFKYKIDVDIDVSGMKDAEVEIDGKRVSTNKGDLEIVIKAILIKDYESRWEDTPFYKFMRAIYEEYIIRKTVDEYSGDLGDDAKNLIADLKAFLRIPT